MKRSLINLAVICLASHLLVSCGMFSSSESEASSKTINKIDNTALTYKAEYGTDYEIQGNVVAKYPHFYLSLFSQETIRNASDNHSTYTYEVTSKDGYSKTHISCNTKDPTKKHFHLEGLHFYYHSNNNGSINIYMPPQLLAHR